MSTEPRTIPPWTRLDCDLCGCNELATRTEPKTITGPYVCSDCKLVEQAESGAEQGAYERAARWYEAGCPVDRQWAAEQASATHLVRDYIAAGLPGWEG